MKTFNVKRTKNKLELSKSKKIEFVNLMLMGLIFGGIVVSFYKNFFESLYTVSNIREYVIDHPGLLISSAFLVLLGTKLIKSIRFILVGEKYLFDSDKRLVLLNGGRILFKYEDVQEVQIRIFSSDDFDSYTLSIISCKGDSFVVEDSKDLSEVKALAGHIADFLNVRVIIKE